MQTRLGQCPSLVQFLVFVCPINRRRTQDFIQMRVGPETPRPALRISTPMPALSWVRFARRLTGIVRQPELPHLESLIDAEASREPYHNLFILSCAIPAGIGIFGAGTVFVAWLSGQTGLPLLLGSIATAVLAAASWFIFYRLYTAIPPSKRRLRKLIQKFTPKYGSIGNIVGAERVLSDDFGAILDEAAGIYLRRSEAGGNNLPTPERSILAIDEALARLFEAALTKDKQAQNEALSWARPLLEEMRRLDASLQLREISALQADLNDPLIGLREARVEVEATTSAINELTEEINQQ